MSNAPKPLGKPNSLDRYRADAAKKADKTGPFVFWVDDDTKLEIPRPTGGVMLEVETASSSRQIITLLAGEHAPQLLEIFEAEDFEVMKAVSKDMQEHFGVGE